jgi:hypothetical protein
MVNKERVQLLVNRLRSGQDVQGYGHLEATDDDGVVRRCCLGVACRVAMDNGLPLAVEPLMSGDVMMFGSNSTSSYLPPEVSEWFGFSTWDRDPYLSSDDEAMGRRPASNFNDHTEADGSRLYTFERIADLFERTYVDGE